MTTTNRRLTATDQLAVGTHGPRSRRGRAALTSAGIAVGIASMVAIMGITSSSRAELANQLDALGTNLLTVEPGTSVFGEQQTLPAEAITRIERIAPVTAASATTEIPTSTRRTPHTPSEETNGVRVLAAQPNALSTLNTTLATGRFLTTDTSHLPVTVLGATAAQRLGIGHSKDSPPLLIGDTWFSVIGTLEPQPLNPELDRAAFIGYPAAEQHLTDNLSPTTIYVRVHPDRIDNVRNVLPPTANPTHPNEVQVSRPSDALAARASVDHNLRLMLLGLAGVALLVGGIGIANVMIISVLERRTEIGTRRALGATRNNIRSQFIIESTLLSAAGGLVGTALGAAATYLYANHQRWTFELPVTTAAAAVAASLAVGATAGLIPATRASRLDPADTVRP